MQSVTAVILALIFIVGLFLIFMGGNVLFAGGQAAVSGIGLFIGGIIMFVVPISLEYYILSINKRNIEIISGIQKISKALNEISQRLKN